MTESLFIASNATGPFAETVWHVGVLKESRSPSGKLFSSTYVTRCSGRQLGSSRGYTKRAERPSDNVSRLCTRCAKLAGI